MGWDGIETYEEIWGIEGVAMKRHTVRGEGRHSAARETIGKEKKTILYRARKARTTRRQES
jgi:hypothetical protein